MCCWRFRGQHIEKAVHGRGCYSEASKEAEVGASRHDLGSEKAQGVPVHKMELLILVQMVRLIKTLVSEMVKRREAEERTVAALERLMKWVEEMEAKLDGEESEKSEVGGGQK